MRLRAAHSSQPQTMPGQLTGGSFLISPRAPTCAQQKEDYLWQTMWNGIASKANQAPVSKANRDNRAREGKAGREGSNRVVRPASNLDRTSNLDRKRAATGRTQKTTRVRTDNVAHPSLSLSKLSPGKPPGLFFIALLLCIHVGCSPVSGIHFVLAVVLQAQFLRPASGVVDWPFVDRHPTG